MQKRYPKLKKGPNGERLCRGCGNPVPKGRWAWCSERCWLELNPLNSRSIALRRDNWTCCDCGLNTLKAKHQWILQKPGSEGAIPGELHKAWYERKPPQAEVDHIVPFSEGGTHHPENLRTLCSECHKARTRKWRQERAKPTNQEKVTQWK